MRTNQSYLETVLPTAPVSIPLGARSKYGIMISCIFVAGVSFQKSDQAFYHPDAEIGSVCTL